MVYKIVELPGGYHLADGRGESIPIGYHPSVKKVEGWYVLAPGTLAELYRERVVDDAEGEP